MNVEHVTFVIDEWYNRQSIRKQGMTFDLAPHTTYCIAACIAGAEIRYGRRFNDARVFLTPTGIFQAEQIFELVNSYDHKLSDAYRYCRERGLIYSSFDVPRVLPLGKRRFMGAFLAEPKPLSLESVNRLQAILSQEWQIPEWDGIIRQPPNIAPPGYKLFRFMSEDYKGGEPFKDGAFIVKVYPQDWNGPVTLHHLGWFWPGCIFKNWKNELAEMGFDDPMIWNGETWE